MIQAKMGRPNIYGHFPQPVTVMIHTAQRVLTRFQSTSALLLAALFLGLSLPAISTAETRQPEMFPDGAHWSAVGDSITHGGSYYAWIYLYYTTRFPEQDLNVANCGISGDTSWGTNSRYDWDVAPTEPTVATIMLGMNDVGRSYYGQEATPNIQQQREKRDDLYRKNMRKLVKQLKDQGATVILLSPTPYDDTADIETKNLKGVNAKLGAYGDFARELAEEEDLTVVDFNGPMTALNEKLQQDDPTFTLIGPDRVHPRTPGHLIMAYLFLTAQGAPAEVSSVTIDSKSLKASADNATVTDLARKGDGVNFTVEENALPFPVPSDGEVALEYIPFTEDLNQELLTVTGLAQGSYTLNIDGNSVGTFTQTELAAGVNLATLTNTPQYQQAQKVLALVKQWRSQVATLRGIAYIEHTRLKDDPKPIDLEQVRPKLEELMNKYKTTDADKPHAGYYARAIENYLKNKTRQEEISQNIEKLQTQIKQAAQPVAHEYSLQLSR
ncbi:MAG: SGNH/GDSL hydrolase family protein [Puniceicoccales bacterium]